MLREAIEIIRRLWQGGYVSHRGAHFAVEDARVFDLPHSPIDIFVAAGGPRAGALAATVDAGVCATEPDDDLLDAYRAAGGGPGRTWGQVVLAWAEDEEAGLADAHAQFRFAAGGWKVQSELPNPVNFAAATQTLEPADLAETIPAGPDPAAHADAVRAYLDLGYERVAVAYPGADPEGFMRFFCDEVRPLV
jgi:G6PDH family F420-dependent oxidoreductase